MSIFLNDWSREYLGKWNNDSKSLEQLKKDFRIEDEDLEGVNILLADYTFEYYYGKAFVLFEKDGKIYEVNGSHCSCYGLEDQWEYDEVLLEELRRRVDTDYELEGCKEELKKVVEELIEAGKYK